MAEEYIKEPWCVKIRAEGGGRPGTQPGVRDREARRPRGARARPRSLGYTARIAAATNALIVTLPSFSALAAHLGSARFDWWMVGISATLCLIAAQLGAAFMAQRVRSQTLTRSFAILLVLLAAQRVFVLLTSGTGQTEGFDVMPRLPLLALALRGS